jgi:hypothetical protein
MVWVFLVFVWGAPDFICSLYSIHFCHTVQRYENFVALSPLIFKYWSPKLFSTVTARDPFTYETRGRFNALIFSSGSGTGIQFKILYWTRYQWLPSDFVVQTTSGWLTIHYVGSEEFPARYEAERSPVSSERSDTRPCPEPHSSIHTFLISFFNTDLVL